MPYPSRSLVARTAVPFLVVSLAWAQPGGAWSDEFDVPGTGLTARVFSLGTFDNDLIVGTYRGLATDGEFMGNVARFDGERYRSLGGGVNGQVRAIATFEGDLIVGGDFSAAGGAPASGIARWDGVGWSPLGAGINGPGGAEVFALAVFEGELYAGGDFSVAGSRGVANVAKWDGKAWAPVTSGTPGPLDVIYGFEVVDQTLFACGTFASIGGVAARNVAAWNGSSWSALGSGLAQTVWTMQWFQGELYAAGFFSGGIQRWDGSTWKPLGPGIGGRGYALEVYEGNLYAGGNFFSAGGTSANQVAQWDGTTWAGVGGVIGNSGITTTFAMTTWNGDLYVGGEFERAAPDASGQQVVSHHLVRFDGQVWSGVGAGLGCDGEVKGMLRWRGKTVMLGRFVVAGGIVANRAVVLDDNGYEAIGSFSGGNGILSAVEFEGDLVVAGDFSTINGIDTNGVARFDGTSWSGFGSGPSLAYGGDALAVYQGDLYVGGFGGIRRWDGSSWRSVGSFAFNDTVAALHVHDNLLYAGGDFSAQGHVVSWDGVEVQGLGGGVNDDVMALDSYRGELVVGGAFTQAGQVADNFVASWDGSAWRSVAPGLRGSYVSELAILRGELYAAGVWLGFGGAQVDYVGHWDGGQWHRLGNGMIGIPLDLLADDELGQLWVGGLFTATGGIPAGYVGAWEPEPRWRDLGHGLAGSKGEPVFRGEGTLLPGRSVRFALSSACENSVAAIVVGSSRVDAPLLGGVLVPSAEVVLPTTTDGVGRFAFELTLGALPSGAAAFYQVWIADPNTPAGVSASNGLMSVIP